MKIEIKKTDPEAKLPKYQHGSSQDAGMDLYAVEGKKLAPGEYKAISIGIAIALPSGYMGKVCPRSGLAFDHGVTVLNAEGTIDPSYRGTIKVVLINHGNEPYEVSPGDRIAQLIVEEYKRASWVEEDELSDTERGEGGFGHTGK